MNHVIEYLEQLVLEGKYSKALECAEKMLLDHTNTPHVLVAIHCAVLQSRYGLSEFYGALISGQLVTKLAEETGQWDYYGTACLNMSVIWDRLGQPEKAKALCYDYLGRLPLYDKALAHQTLVWYNLGIYHILTNNASEAITALTRSLTVAEALGDDRDAHGIRQALIQAYQKSGEYARIPTLLAKCLHYLRHHPDVELHQHSLLSHLKLRSEFAMHTHRLGRALAVARRGLSLAGGHAVHQFHFHLILARIAFQKGNLSVAFENALASRVHAIKAHRFDLESVAVEFMYECAKCNSDLVYQSADQPPRIQEYWRPIGQLP